MSEVETSLTAAHALLNQGDLDAATNICERLLIDAPQSGRAWQLRGIIRGMQHDFEGAIESLKQATRVSPRVANHHYNLGLAYRHAGRIEDAIESYRRAVELNPDFLEAQNNLGNGLIDHQELSAAVSHFRRLAERFPADSIVHFNLANVLQSDGESEEAICIYRQIVQRDPEFSEAWNNLGRLLLKLGRQDEAVQIWRQWLDQQPDCAVAQHMIASVTGEGVPECCSEDFIRSTFDHHFAQSYDRQLKSIGYRVPELIERAIESLDLPRASLQILDAGCGTGLCAPILKPYAKRLTGVDLSVEMLEEARHGRSYDRLVESELSEFLCNDSDHYDLIVLADTLCYFGDLRHVFDGAARCLSAHGSLVFSVEQLKTVAAEAGPGSESYELQSHGRYRHAETYIRQCLRDSGFRQIDAEEGTLRLENGQPVAGMIFVASRSRQSPN
jgi:predicted TPR repeat methyltransferase